MFEMREVKLGGYEWQIVYKDSPKLIVAECFEPYRLEKAKAIVEAWNARVKALKEADD